MNRKKRYLGNRSRSAQKGSALLIVFVFAAMVAIMLYMELPVSIFEARRQKEQLLEDRGNEYAHAVKLYVRRFGHYPASIDQLEDTNRMRFLRHRFKDPFTGKDDWRLLHAGPGGMLLDSKVQNKNPLGVPGQIGGANSTSASNTASAAFGSNSSFGSNSGFGSSSGFGSNSNSGSKSGFGSNSSFGSSSNFDANGSFGASSNSAPEVVVPPVRQRPPAVQAGGGESGVVAATAPNENQDPNAALLPSGQAEQLQQADELQTPNSSGANAAGQTGTSGQPGVGAQANGAPGRALMINGPPPHGFAGGGMGTISGGGIAGVASKAGGKTIKEVNDQTDYSLWEFYYDPSKDLMRGAGAMAPGAAPGQTGAPTAAPQSTNGGFGAAPANPAPQNSTDTTTAGPQPQEPQTQQGPQSSPPVPTPRPLQPQNPQQQAPQPQQPPE